MRLKALLPIVALLSVCAAGYAESTTLPSDLDVPYEPTHPQVVAEMLKMAGLKSGEVMYDLGCGDGRLCVSAAKIGARATGYDLDPQRLREARENAQLAKVLERVKFIQGDIMEVGFRDADVITLYLLNEVNLRLRPHLFDQLKPGARVVSHAFHMGDWEADQTLRHDKARNNLLSLWVIPARAGGQWTWTDGQMSCHLSLDQEFQVLSGKLAAGSAEAVILTRAQIKGKEISLDAELTVAGRPAKVRFAGTVEGDKITGTQTWVSGTRPWSAQRTPVNPLGYWDVTYVGTQPNLKLAKLALRANADGTIQARYGQDAPSKRLVHMYVFGGSLRFDVSLSEDSSAVYRGSVEGDAMRGKVTLPDSTEVEWSAKRGMLEP